MTTAQKNLIKAIKNNTAPKGIQSNTRLGRTLGVLIQKGLVTADQHGVAGERFPGRRWLSGFICYSNLKTS